MLIKILLPTQFQRKKISKNQ